MWAEYSHHWISARERGSRGSAAARRRERRVMVSGERVVGYEVGV
jgi:hypothetical protein